MQLDLYVAYLRQLKFRAETKSGLRIRERIVPMYALKSREARFLSLLEPTEKGLERLIQTPQCVVQNLRVDIRDIGTNFLNLRKLVRLRVVVEFRSRSSVSVSAFLQRGVVEFAAHV